MRTITVGDIDSILESLRPSPNRKLEQKVASIISNVKLQGDKAIRKYEKRFGGLGTGSFRVSKTEIKRAYSQVSKEQIQALKIMKKRLEKSELAIKRQLHKTSVMNDGVRITKVFTPLASVGCYIPGGQARYPSSLVMSVVPAKLAGVNRIIAVSPANRDGFVDSLTLVAADLCEVDGFYKIGGAQAIAALAYGTGSIPKVDKIVGPGGTFVSIAKSFLSNIVAVDMVAGPTELAIIGDDSTDPDIVALDLVSQAEHSQDTVCGLITTSRKLTETVNRSIKQKMKVLKRKEIVKESLQKNGFIVICKREEQVVELANKLAPEHLEIMVRNPNGLAKKINSAGLTLLGKNSPSAASDYLFGSNHILPTNGFGRSRGSLGILDFLKIDTKIEASRESLKRISKSMKFLTDAEGLPNHYEAVRKRLR